MKKLCIYILIIAIIISGCRNTGNTNITEEPQITQTSIVPTPEQSNETPIPTVTSDDKNSNDIEEPKSQDYDKKLDYDIDISNYDILGEKEKYLLQVKLEYQVSEDEIGGTNYFIDIDEINQMEGYYEILGSSIIPEELELLRYSILRISEDGRRALIKYYNSEDYVVEVIDILNRKVLYQYKTKNRLFDISSLSVITDSNIEHMKLSHDDGFLYIDVLNQKETLKKCPAEVISPDGAKTAVIWREEDESILKIYNLTTEQLLESIELGKGDIYLTQWHKSGKLLFQSFEGSFYYDINTKEITLIGQYFYDPIMSPDGKYVAFNNHNDTTWYYPLYDEYPWMNKLCGYYVGLYIKNMETNKIIQVAPFLEYEYLLYNQIPVQWVYVNNEFDNNKNRWCIPTDKEAEYIIDCSSVKEAYSYENIFDKNANTAWVEDEEHYYDYNGASQGKNYDGKGIGEWIKIYKLTKAISKYTKYDDNNEDDIGWGYMESFRLSGIKIINGYAKSRDIYFANNRVKKVEVILSDGSSYIFDLEDNNLGFQTLDFGKEIETRQVVIKILDIYEGSKYNDTCISEVELIEVAKNN